MGNIIFIIVVVVVVIAVLIYRKMQTATASSHTKAVKQAVAKPTNVDSKPTEQEPSVTETETETETEQPEVKQDQPLTIKPQAVVEEEYPQVEPNLPEALAEAVSALTGEKDALARHRWLSQITETTYKKRKDAQYRAACDYFSVLHINEFEKIKAPLKKSNGGKLPQVMTFQNYANLLLEDERYNEAIEVCQKALKFGLDDKTKSGFAGRIERIKARQKQAK
ncbi:hypothetical protein [Aliidiomarina quisquiliarum]|uniref:hypothetical protein n=1 Tax=Aliidiomarina quisquiliarum TaxID=2938947 RepID=UPI00208FC7FF|nr:hypothetical protein [Aliidiomarina quisquiliarum]MCO4321306.1 hypothetical protein [Aliidiomarina quisquiliarum]